MKTVKKFKKKHFEDFNSEQPKQVVKKGKKKNLRFEEHQVKKPLHAYLDDESE